MPATKTMRPGARVDINVDGASYFVSRITITVTDPPGMARWRKKLLAAMARNAASPVDSFGLPVERTVTMASTIPV
jgi:KUP system potassium uptake protein